MNEINIELSKLGIVVGPECMNYWSDSSIVIAWIHSQQLLKTYVANRVAQIHDHTIKEQWRHVSTTCNPADLISRGVPVESLQHSELWWNGPQWLNKDECTWPKSSVVTTDVTEVRTVKLVLTATHEVNNPILERQSSWLLLIRITAWILRFAHNTKTSANHEKINGPLTFKELQAAQLVWFRIAQPADFPRELHDLQKTRQVARKSCLRTLNPFIDVDGLIHVGDRMTATSLSYTIKHPIVIHSRHKITRLFFKYEHERLLHVGPQALLAQMHRFCWPIRGKALAKTIVHNCITCYRFSPKLQTPLMAPLPKERVKIERPFFRSSVDFCGPVHIKSGIRRVKSIKCYIAVFICFVTRAIHLELVTDMTSNAFLAALTRFMSRRGTCSHIHSDNGTNFVGANKELRNYFQNSNATRAVNDTLANHRVQWHFNPPSASHFGGLWEAAVKSAKHHLLKATKGALLTFEEMSTLLCRVEAILNSRPMTSISSNRSNLEVLTPSHFLTGGPAILPQELDVSTIPINRLQRFELMRAQIQTFWKIWSLEYTPQLQKRGRWASISRNWKSVRIVATHPGKDNVVRVVTVKLSTGTELKRPVAKLALLPTPDEYNEEDNNHMIG
ncbi:uncharacterized protein LOC112681100 [Sipha flava]|uniref:Uncharacterized protein LOC112681100 n=1 Tax=Sipha flava TaxID=143950 RepID=A0A8B8F9T8_9HEMI|nr:uncharacterized protein LOC112681100 [Sipha flava]